MSHVDILQRFQALTKSYNENFLDFLRSFQEVVSEQNEVEEVNQYQKLTQAFDKWAAIIVPEPRTLKAAQHLYSITAGYHEQILAFDCSIFGQVDQDLLSRIFDTPGINTSYLFSRLQEAALDAEVSPEVVDEKKIFWESLKGLYSFAFLFDSYESMPELKEIISTIFAKQTDFSKVSLMSVIKDELRNRNSPIRRMLKNMLKGKENVEKEFEAMVHKLQMLLQTFYSSSSSAGPQLSAEEIVANKKKLFEYCQKQGVLGLTNTQYEQVFDVLVNEPNSPAMEAMVNNDFFTVEQAETIIAFIQHEKIRVSNPLHPHQKFVKDMSETMQKMMNMENKEDPEALQQVLDQNHLPFKLSEFKEIEDDLKNLEDIVAEEEEDEKSASAS